MFRGEKSHGLLCTQFLCALIIYLGRDRKIKKNKMSKFFQNLSMQALSKKNSEVLLNFDKVTKLVKEINMRLQDIIC